MKVKSEKEVAQSCPTLSDPMDYSLPGSSIHGIFQARVLEWGAIAFSMMKLQYLMQRADSLENTHLVVKKSGEGNGNPLQYSCLENPMDGGAW